MGMSRSDFERCTPSEFKSIWVKWKDRQEALSKESWEQLRWLMLTNLQPHSKKTLTLEDVLKFPWDNKKTSTAQPPQSQEEIQARFDKAKAKYGLQ